MKAEPVGSTVNEPAPVRRMFRSLAHDIRGPIGVASGALDQIEADLQDAQAEINPRLMGMARRSLRRVLRLTERLSRASELEGATDELPISRIDACALTRQAHEDVVAMESRRGVDITLDFGGQDRVEAVANAEWLRFALGELLALAVRHARRKVVVQVSGDVNALSLRIEFDGTLPVSLTEPSPELGDCTSDAELLVKTVRAALSRQGLGLSVAPDGAMLVQVDERPSRPRAAVRV